MRIEKISASSYNTYDFCEWQWTLSYLLGFYDKGSQATVLGSIVHDTLEDISRRCMDGDINPEHLSKEDKLHIVTNTWNNSFNKYYSEVPQVASKIKTSKLTSACHSLIDLVDSIYSPFSSTTIGVEQWFDIHFDENRFKIDDNKYLRIRGKIDRIEEINDSTIEIIDYKTGRRNKFTTKKTEKYEASSLSQEIQPGMYYMAARELYPDKPNVLITFIFLTDGGEIMMPYDPSHIPIVKEKIYQRYLDIRNNNSPKRNRGWHCNKICSFGPNGMNVCDKVWTEKESEGLQFVKLKYECLNRK